MNSSRVNQEEWKNYSLFGLYTLAIRLVVGWTYFSAFWRRLVLENKLIPDSAGYIGEKFNHFLPNSIGIRSVIEYLVTHPEILWWAMVVFTLVEGIVGLLFMLGFFTRLMSVGVMSLATGILLGSGWLGTTCLDEWQIGILGVAAGFTVFLSGGGRYSVDAWCFRKWPIWSNKKWLLWLTSGTLPLPVKWSGRVAVGGAAVILLLSLYTNQEFHNGVWGPLHNKSVKPKIEISDATIKGGELSFTIYRVEGVDVYGSFLIGVTLVGEGRDSLFYMDGKALSRFPEEQIHNEYVAKIKPGKHSLVIPLGGKAELTFRDTVFSNLPKGSYQLILTDISGATFQSEIIY